MQANILGIAAKIGMVEFSPFNIEHVNKFSMTFKKKPHKLTDCGSILDWFNQIEKFGRKWVRKMLFS